MGGAANAQQQEEGDRDVEELVVTGTRIPRNDFTTPNPVATMDREDIDALGLVSVGDILGQITSNVYSASLDTVGDGAFFVGATLANLRGMNTGFGTRTLTLVNGRRMPPTTNGGGVDLGMIPSVLVGRVETATGGNGATYGTDAMAGVVNIIIDTRFEGTRVDAGFYQTDAGDGNQYTFSLANGMRFLEEGRGHLVIGYEHQTVDPIRDCSTARDWCARSFNWLDNAINAGQAPPINLSTATELPPIAPDNVKYPGMGWPRYHITDGVRYLHTSPYGSLHTYNDNPDDPFNGEFLEFTPDGRSVIPYNTEADGLVGAYRQAAYADPGERVVGGEGALYTKGYPLRNGSVRNNFYARFNYDFNDRLSVNAELGFNRNNGETFQERPGFNSTTHCIYADNGFLTLLDDTARQAMLDRQSTCTVNGQVFLASPGTEVHKDWTDQLDRRVKTETEMLRFVIGANGGMFGSDRWTWDTYFQYGETDRYQLLQNNQTRFRYDMAEDAYFDPVQGQIVCRVNALDAVGEQRRNSWRNFFQGSFSGTAPTAEQAMERVDALRAGCVPLNPFGHAASPEAIAYAYDDLIEFTYTTQRVLSGTVSGTLFDGIGAGPARIATGIDWREDLTDNQVGGDPNNYVRTDFSAQYGDPWTGGVEVGDIFAEFEMPLLRDKPAAQYMMINLSNRRSRNTTFREDSTESLDVDRYSTTWKTSFVWDPTNWLRIRSTRSADIRSPAPRELFYRQTFQGGGYFNFSQNPWRTVNLNGDTWDTIIGANPNLQNEESRTETFGFVITPGGIGSGLQFAADYVETYIKGGISYATGSDPENEDNLPYTIFRCYVYDDPYYCGLIEFGPPTLEEPNNPRSDILSITTTQENSEAFWTKAIDLSASYRKQLRRGGSYSIRLLGTYTIEQMVCTDTTRVSPTETRCNERQDVVGQTGGLYSGGNVFANYTATPEWSANLYGTYRKGPFSVTAQARYIGEGKVSTLWVGPEDPRWGPELWYTMDINTLPSWTTWNATFNYDFAQSRFAPSRFQSFRVGLVVDNVFDRQPDFWSGGSIGGINQRFFSGMGRSYRLNLNMEF
ncbi:MAG TPA: TonB-dependent receptor plug domain-containing protein [Gammaproteobacteria bacterium]